MNAAAFAEGRVRLAAQARPRRRSDCSTSGDLDRSSYLNDLSRLGLVEALGLSTISCRMTRKIIAYEAPPNRAPQSVSVGAVSWPRRQNAAK